MLGAHVSIADPLNKKLEAVQIFLGSPKSIHRKDKSVEDIDKIIDCFNGMQINIHASYLINLSAPKPSVIDLLRKDCYDAHRLGTRLGYPVSVVIHLGKSLHSETIDDAYNTFAETLGNLIVENNNNKVVEYRILLETSAHQGTEIGFNLMDLHRLFELTISKIPSLEKKLGICLDTCHIHVSGEYDLSSKEQTSQYIEKVHSLFGNNVKLIHLNDSVKGCDSHCDRHEHLTKGTIFQDETLLFQWILYASTLNIPIILETPDPFDEDLDLLHKLRNKMGSQVLEMLEELIALEKSNKERMKVKAYVRAYDHLKTYFETNEFNYQKIKDLDGIGKGILGKIDELFKTGKLEKLKDVDKGLVKTIMALTQISGIGEAKATELHHLNIRSITALKKRICTEPTLLTDVQKLNLKHHKDLSLRIPREDIIAFETQMKEIDRLILSDEEYGTITGSYRRGAKDSGDIDYLLYIHKENIEKWTAHVMSKLKVVGILSQGKSKIMLLIRLNKIVRHLDIVFVTDKHQFPFTLLYFTGSKETNLMMRGVAKSKGYVLNEWELKNSDLKPTTEKDIFDFLEIPYLKPNER